MRLVIVLLFLSAFAEAHELQFLGQHIKLNRQNESAWQQDLLARAVLSRKHEMGIQTSYLERFDLHENRLGGFYTFRPNDQWAFEAKYLRGNDVVILPHDQYSVSVYHSLTAGMAPYLIYKNSMYSVTHLQTVTAGLEIEKIPSIIIIPQLTSGTAKFNQPNSSKNLFNAGLRIVHYKEALYSVFAFGYQGKEAAQGIVGESNITVNTKTAGLGGSYYFIPSLKSEITFDYTDYEQLRNQFVTTTLNLSWVF